VSVLDWSELVVAAEGIDCFAPSGSTCNLAGKPPQDSTAFNGIGVVLDNVAKMSDFVKRDRATTARKGGDKQAEPTLPVSDARRSTKSSKMRCGRAICGLEGHR
jgi:hypothetical protein